MNSRLRVELQSGRTGQQGIYKLVANRLHSSVQRLHLGCIPIARRQRVVRNQSALQRQRCRDDQWNIMTTGSHKNRPFPGQPPAFMWGFAALCLLDERQNL